MKISVPLVKNEREVISQKKYQKTTKSTTAKKITRTLRYIKKMRWSRLFLLVCHLKKYQVLKN